MEQKSAPAIENEKPVCVVCGEPYFCPPKHVRRETCGNYECVLKRKGQKHGIEFMSREEIRQFLTAAKKLGFGYYLAFRLAINGMLKIKDLNRLRVEDLRRYRDENDPDKPCILTVGKCQIELDCETLSALDEWCFNRKGKLFPYSYRTIQRMFRQAIRNGNLYEYTFHALRHTGIILRARVVQSLSDLTNLQRAARFKSLQALRPYLMAEDTNLIRRVQFAK